MSHIHIRRDHEMTLEQSKQAAEQIAEQLGQSFELTYHWQKDSLRFERSGVSGQIDLDEGLLRINVRLGFLLSPIKSLLEEEIHRYLDQLFAPHT